MCARVQRAFRVDFFFIKKRFSLLPQKACAYHVFQQKVVLLQVLYRHTILLNIRFCPHFEDKVVSQMTYQHVMNTKYLLLGTGTSTGVVLRTLHS